MQKPFIDYQLLDFGGGRKLERFGSVVVDRPAPAAQEATKQAPAAWTEAHANYSGHRMGGGSWRGGPPKEGWPTTLRVPLPDERSFHLQVEPTPAGQVGLFPEQFANWQWIARQVDRCPKPCRVLNLFAYTGGSTLAAAAAGAQVTHVDASKPAVATARANAQISELGEAPIRWIIEDAARYCRRELRRGRRYDAVILDPPTYGHGPKGEAWRIDCDLLPLLDLCRQLTAGRLAFALASCHSPGIGPAELAAYLGDGLFGHCAQPPASGRLWLQSADGRRLDSGVWARWPS